MDNCPMCSRRFEIITDFPSVYIVKFERFNVPEDLIFPGEPDQKIFVGPKAKSNNPRPPQEVIAYFQDNRKIKSFEYGGYIWSREGGPKSGDYTRRKKDERQIIFSQIDPYFDTLEKLVGTEVKTCDALPKFPRYSYCYLDIPNTSRKLNFTEPNYFRLAIIPEKREVKFSIAKFQQGNMFVVDVLVDIGKLYYEGKLNK